jgi:hypothetical protein
MHYLPITVTEYLKSDTYPDWVRCRFEDAHGKEWTIVEKVPVITPQEFDHNTPLPYETTLAIRILKTFQDAENREIARVDTNEECGVWSEDGVWEFDVLKSQIIEQEPPY